MKIFEMKYFCTLFFWFVFQSSFHVLSQTPQMSEILLEKTKKMSLTEKIEYYLNSAENYQLTNPDSSLYFSNLAYFLAVNADDREKADVALLQIARSYEVKAQYDTAQVIINRLIRPDKEKDKLYYSALISKGRILDRLDKYSLSLAFLDTAMNYFQQKGDSLSVKEIASVQASVYTSLGKYPNALSAHQRALHIAEIEKDTVAMILEYAKIGTMYMRMESFERAYNHFRKGMSISENYQRTNAYKTLLNSMAGYFNRKRVFDSAEMFYLKGLAVTKKLNKMDDLAGSYLNIGNLYCRKGQFEKGKANFDTALAIFTDLGMEANKAIVYNSYSTMYGVLGEQDSSLHYAMLSLSIGRKTNNSRRIKTSLYRIAAAYDKMGNYRRSLEYAKKFIFYNDSVTSAETRAKVAELEAKYEAAKKERNIIRLRAERKAQKDKELKLLIVFISIVIILVLIVIGVLQKRNKDKKIYEQKQLVQQKQKALTEAELEKSKLKENELKNEIQYKSKQLTTHALNMMQKNTLMQEILDEIELLGKRGTDNKNSFNKLKLLIKKNLRSENDWELFKLYFEDVNKTFYEELAKINNDLTTNDLKLCALLKLNMNIKESASVLSIEPASVKTARYKLRKKLHLKPEEDLVEFIRRVD
jgi:tetratricopeptide (TPR) repeat protein